MRKESTPGQSDFRDKAALCLSLVPGLGHLYKGHLLAGALIFLVIGPVILVVTAATVTATVGLSLALPALFMGGVMFHAFYADDRRADVIARAQAMNKMSSSH